MIKCQKGDEMDIIIWLLIMMPCSMLITGIGIYAWKRKKPMWFWSGTTVSENEINDIPAYNKAKIKNGGDKIFFSKVTIAVFLWSDNDLSHEQKNTKKSRP